MPILRVVDRRTRRQRRMDPFNAVLLKVCRAGVTSYFDIEVEMGTRLGYAVSHNWVCALMAYNRREAERTRWIIPYAPKGPNPSCERRFIPVLLDRDGTQHTDDENDAIDHGSTDNLKILATTAARFQTMLLGEAMRSAGRNRPRRLRALASTVDHIETKLQEMLEEFTEDTA